MQLFNTLNYMIMKVRYSKTISQQCRYYEVENIFDYMVSVYQNGNISTFTTLFKELEKEARKDFIDYLFDEVEPIYWTEILKATI